MIANRDIKKLRDRIGVSHSVATELLTLSGGDLDLAEECSRNSTGLTQCKAAIIDRRFNKIEQEKR